MYTPFLPVYKDTICIYAENATEEFVCIKINDTSKLYFNYYVIIEYETCIFPATTTTVFHLYYNRPTAYSKPSTVLPWFMSLIRSSRLLVSRKLVKQKLISEKRRREQRSVCERKELV
jgi:hypothetical protein